MGNIYAIIPARYGSSRFPGKPLALICNRPMIQHVYERACMCKQLDEVYVATDDEKIMACVQGFGGKAIMTSQGHRSGTDRIYETAKRLNFAQDDIIVNIQGDQPAFQPSLIPLLVEPLLKDKNISISTLKYPITDKRELSNPNCVKVVTDSYGFALYFSRMPIPYCREEGCDITYYKHLGLYAYRVRFLEVFTRLDEGKLEKAERLEQLRALENGYKIKVMKSPYNSIEVDIQEDIHKAEEVICPEGA